MRCFGHTHLAREPGADTGQAGEIEFVALGMPQCPRTARSGGWGEGGVAVSALTAAHAIRWMDVHTNTK